MTVEVVCATMHQTDFSKIEEMNIHSDVVFANQADRTDYDEYEFQGHKAKMITTATRGVGINRNLAFMYASADILLLADDDIVYADGYEKKLVEAFEENPKADVILFNFLSLNPARPTFVIKKKHRIHWYNCLKYGAFCIAIRREAVLRKNLCFTQLFGGGARHSAGEDNLFITECLRAGLRVIAHPAVLGTVRQEESTWFRGYTQKYYYDRGVLFAAMYGKKAWWILLLFEIKGIRRKKEIPFRRRLLLERKGAREFLRILR